MAFRSTELTVVWLPLTPEPVLVRSQSPGLNWDQRLYLSRIKSREGSVSSSSFVFAPTAMSVSATGPPWRNNSLVLGGDRDPPLSDQGETIIGVYLLLLGRYTHTLLRPALGSAGFCLLQLYVPPSRTRQELLDQVFSKFSPHLIRLCPDTRLSLSPRGWLSWFGNSIVLFVLYRQRSSLQPTDYLTFNLAVSDASISVFGYSRGIIEIFNVFQDSGFLISSIWTCQVHAVYRGIVRTLSVGGHVGLEGLGTCTVPPPGGRFLHAGVWSEQHQHADGDQRHPLHQRMPPQQR